MLAFLLKMLTKCKHNLKDLDKITSVPTDMEEKPKKKDPKKVAAGKALAKKNKEAREALKNSKDKDKESVNPLSFLDVSNGLQMTAGLIGSCIVIYHGYRFFYPPNEESKKVDDKHEMVDTNQVEELAPVEEPKQTNIDME